MPFFNKPDSFCNSVEKCLFVNVVHENIFLGEHRYFFYVVCSGVRRGTTRNKPPPPLFHAGPTVQAPILLHGRADLTLPHVPALLALCPFVLFVSAALPFSQLI